MNGEARKYQRVGAKYVPQTRQYTDLLEGSDTFNRLIGRVVGEIQKWPGAKVKM